MGNGQKNDVDTFSYSGTVAISSVDDLLGRRYRVLVFPPVSNYHRFLIHKLVQESFPALKTFSVGEADARRTVVCFLADYKLEPNNCKEQTSESRQTVKRPRTMPSVGIYLPPAARKLEENAANVSCPSFQPQTPSKQTPTSTQVAIAPIEKRNRQRRPDMAVYVPRGQRIAQEHQRKLDALARCHDGVVLQLDTQTFEQVDSSENDKEIRLANVIEDETTEVVCHNNEESPNMTDSKNLKNHEKQSESKTCLDNVQPIDDNQASTCNISLELIDLTTNEVEVDVVPQSTDETKIDEKVESIKRETLVNSDSQEITEETIQFSDNAAFLGVEKIVAASENVPTPQPKDKAKNVKTPTLNPDELDWDALYDDSGECLDPKLLGQLTNAVGQVAIETPKSSLREKHRNLEDEFPHVIEVYNFPPEFKTPDLVMVFSDFKNSGFEIKWVDDTHALGVFSNAAVVSEVLAMQHPFVKTRCLSEGSQQSKSKARRCADSLTPYMARPDTCAALARRLVTGALGVRLPTQHAEREAERKLLREAKEKKKLAAKQREEAWEGNFS